MSRLLPLVRRLTNLGVLIFLALLTVAFSLGSYRWAFKVNRMKPQAINPVMYPTFTYVNTSRMCCSQEPYYNLWRTFDWLADAYAVERQVGEYLRVPVMYVHGNAGSYFCARSLARFLYEANVRQRRLSLRHFSDHVKRVVYQEMQHNATLASMNLGDEVPEWLVRKAEEKVVWQHTPILATEMFSVDFHEESFTQSAVMMIKEARFLNHSMHFLMQSFLSTYAQTLAAPAPASLFEDPSAAEENKQIRTSTYPLSLVEEEYVASCCRHDNGAVAYEADICEKANQQLARYSTLARVQAEVRRVQENGLWVWAESLGGAISIVAAIMNPSLYAGIIFVGSPTHYPPLFFDVGSAWMYKVISDAVLHHYPQTTSLHDHTVDWERDILPHRTPLELLQHMKPLPSESFALRLSNVTLLTVNGGALDDIVPSISGYTRRSTPRGKAFYTEENRKALAKHGVDAGAFHRDVSTETMRGVGQAMDHRGLVYGLQFLNHSADSIVLAALLPNADAHFAPEALLPSTLRDRLFPTVTETLPAERYERSVKETLFAHTLTAVDKSAETLQQLRQQKLSEESQSENGEAPPPTPPSMTTEEYLEAEHRLGQRANTPYAQWTFRKNAREQDALQRDFEEKCVMQRADEAPIDLNSLPTREEEEAYLYDSTSAAPLHLFFGFTTFTPEEVFMPRLELCRDAECRERVPTNGVDDMVQVRPATKLHLPFMRKDARRSIYGRILSTLISFQVTRRNRDGIAAAPNFAYARFCFQVERNRFGTPTEDVGQHSFVQYDKIDPTSLLRKTAPRYLGSHYVGNALAVETHPGYALATGLDSTTQETRMQIDVPPGNRAYPFVMSGTLRTFLLIARGNTMVLADDPEEQAQYFFGPFSADLTQFNYSWKPFSTFEADLNETYLVYVIGDNTKGRANVTLNDIQDAVDATGLGALFTGAKLRWWMDQWPERWLAFFSAYSAIGKLGGAYVLFFFSFFIVGGESEKWFMRDAALRARWASPLSKRIFYTSPLLIVLFLTAAEEYITGSWAEYALKVCHARDPPPLLSDAEMTARMDWLEKLTLVVLFAMKPNYRDCRYSWVRMQSVPVWSSFAEHIATIYFGYVLTAAMLMVLFAYLAVVYLVSGAVHLVLRTKKLFQHRRMAMALLFLWWALPNLSWLLLPNVPLSYRHFISVSMLVTTLPLIPWITPAGYCFPLYLGMISTACVFPAHFDGAALTIRNHVMLRRVPEAFWDHERNTNITSYQVLIRTMVQGALACGYLSVYYVAMSHRTLERAAIAKQTEAAVENGKSKMGKSSTTNGKGAVCISGYDPDSYTLGDFCRRHRSFARVIHFGRKLLIGAAVWITVVVLRRPMEGGVILVGNMVLLLLMLTKLLAQW